MKLRWRISCILAVVTWAFALMGGVSNILAAKTSLDLWVGAWMWNSLLWFFGTQALLLLCISFLLSELIITETGHKKWPIVWRYLSLISISILVAVPMLTIFQNLATFG
mgnify:CR=1 FL=1